MDLSLFSTQLTQGGKNGALTGSTNPLLGGTPLNGAAFLEVILGNILSDGEAKVDTKKSALNTNDNVSSDNVKKENADLALLQLALLGQDADLTLDEKLAELKIEKLALTQENRVEQLTKLINHLTSGLPQEVTSNIGAESTIEDLVTRLNKRLEKLGASLEAFRNNDFNDDDAPFKLLIATGLNPAQLTNITSRIEEVETKLGRELTVEDLIAGVGNIIPASGSNKGDNEEFETTDALALLLRNQRETDLEREALGLDVMGNEQVVVDAPLNLTELATPIAQIAKGVDTTTNAIKSADRNTGNTRMYDVQDLINMITPNKVAPSMTGGTVVNPTLGDTTILPEDGITPLPSTMSNAEFKALFGKGNGIEAKNVVTNLQTANLAPNASVPTLNTAGALTLPTNFVATFGETLTAQNALSDALGYDIQTGTPFTQTMQAAHSVTSMTQSAGQAHNGTSMVAAKMTKAAQSGDTRNITLQLDPPELGRVEIRMEFGADSKVKAHLVVEKPETLLMLQRDTAALDKALQDAGMETDSDSLNYEMAEDNYGFGQDGKGKNGQSGTDNAKTNTGNSDEDELEIIETTMNWDVDPNTGHVHYNIMA